ncbi:MAG: hypothetical protein E7163_06130 [Firmicutes bacterium]|nr:hypothetical protein [Bacillota bacterium]
MGQYYKFINLDKKEICDRSKGFLKLTEHSYIGNEYCNDILTLLSNEWKGDRVIHVGDYAEGNDGTTTGKLIDKIERENEVKTTVYDWSRSFEEIEPNKVNDKIRYVYNLDKKMFIDLIKQPIQWCCYNDNKISFAKFNAFALLTGCGNEQGGGDYFYHNKKKIGLWAGDKLVSSETPLKEYENFTEQKYIFDEGLLLSRRIKSINDKTEKQVLNLEGVMLKHFLNKYKDYYNMDLSKVKISKNRLTENEYKHFNTILNKYRNKLYNKEKMNLER